MSVIRQIPFLASGSRITATAAAVSLGSSMVLIVGTMSVIDRCFLSPLPYSQAERMVVVSQPIDSNPKSPVAFSDFWMFLRQNSRTLLRAGAWRLVRSSLADAAGSRSALAAYVSEDTCNMLRIMGPDGHSFTPEDRIAGQPGVCWLSAQAAARFNIAPHSLARDDVTLRLDGHPIRVVGILSPSYVFPGPKQPDLYLPLEGSLERFHRSGARLGLTVFGQIGDRQTLDAVETELTGLNAQFRVQMKRGVSDTPGQHPVAVVSLRDWLNRGSYRQVLLLALTACVLFISAWASTMMLEVAGTLARAGDASIRRALGANIWHLLRVSLVRLLPGFASASLIGLALWSVCARYIDSFAGMTEDRSGHTLMLTRLAIGGLLFLFLSVFAGALLPTLAMLKFNPLGIIQKSRTVSPGGAGQQALLTAQIAAAVVSVFLTTVLTRSLMSTLMTDTGINVKGLYAIDISASDERYRGKEARRVLYQRLRLHMRELPGVAGITFVSPMPLEGISSTQAVKILAGKDGEERTIHNVSVVYGSPDVLSVLGGRIVAGENGVSSGAAGQDHDVYANHNLASWLGSGQRVFGRMIQTAGGGGEKPRGVRAVYADISQRGLDRDAGPELMLPFEEAAPASFGLIVRFPSAARPIMHDLERYVWDVDPTLTIESAMPLSRRVARQYEDRLVQSGVVAAASIVSLILVSLCIYAFVWANVEHTSWSLGIRMALGATPFRLRAEVVRNVMLSWVSGSAAAAALAAASWTWMRSVVTELEKPALDLFVLAAAVSLVMALTAAWGGTRRIVSVDPAETLRSA